MVQKAGRNDPCPCGSGKKYKNCCWSKNQPGAKKKFTATLLSNRVPTDLVARTYTTSLTNPPPGQPSSLSNRIQKPKESDSPQPSPDKPQENTSTTNHE